MDYTDFQAVFLVVGKFRIGFVSTAPWFGVEAVNIHGIRTAVAFDVILISSLISS